MKRKRKSGHDGPDLFGAVAAAGEAAELPAALPPMDTPPAATPPPVVVDPVPAPAPETVNGAGAVTAMQQAALVFLDDPIARRLAVAWSVCQGREHEWFEAAGLGRHDPAAVRISKALVRNGICRVGGVTDELAMKYIHAVISRPLSAAAATAKRLREKEN